MTRRWLARCIAIAAVLAAALAAYAVGNGDITATPAVTIITIASPTGTGTGTAVLANTTAATTYNVVVGSDASCDPQLTFMVAGGNPVAIGPGSSRSVQLGCPPRGSAAMRRCLYHAKNSENNAALADFMSVCLYGSAMTLVPQQTALDFGTVAVGDDAMLELSVRNDGAQPITRVYLQTTDLEGNFQLATPCNPDAAFCDADITAVPPGGTLPLQIKCTPQAPGMHSAQLHIGTDTFQLLAQPITLTCMGSPVAVPVLGANPSLVELPPIEVLDGSASTSVHLKNIGDGTLVIRDVRVVDVDLGAATDWTYTATGECTGTITTSCSLEAGESVEIALVFDPAAIGRRRATLLISYRDTVDRTKAIPLLGTGLGATLELLGSRSSVQFGMVPIGRSSTLDFELVNRGNRDVTAQLGLTAGTTPPFSVLPGATAVVVPTVPKTVSLTCAPTAAGVETATLTAEAMDAFGGSAISVNARCEGSTLELFANPTALDFGEIRLGDGAVRRTIQLLGTGGVVTLAGQPQQEAVNAAVSIGALSQSTTPATFDVTITPSSEGEIATTIAVSDDDGNTLRIPVTGRIVNAGYEATTKLDLGTFCVNQPTTSSNASLAAIGTGTIALTAPTLGGSPSPFQLTATNPPLYPTTLPPGRTATVAITPRRQAAPGELSDTLTWHTDVDGAPTATTELTARFIDQGGAIAPPALDFGKVTVHLYSENGQRVVIQNCNPTPLVLDPPMIKTPFSIDSPNFPAMLNPNETVTFSVGFHPTRIGVVMHTLRITSPQLPGAPLEVLLVGEGVTSEMPSPDAGTEDKDKGTSFYACSCKSSRPSGIAPIVLAIVYAGWRRRRRATPTRGSVNLVSGMRRARARLLAAAVVITTAGVASAAFDLVVTNPAVGGPAHALTDGGLGSDVPDVGIGSDGFVGSDAPRDAGIDSRDGGFDAGDGGVDAGDGGVDADAGGPVLAVTPTVLDFQSLPVGQTASQMVLLRNDGTVPLTNIVITLGANAMHWSISDCTAASPCTLPTFGSQILVTVTFQPMAHDDKSTMAQVASSQTPVQYIDLRGIGLGGVMVITNPPLTDGYHLDLGTIPRGQTTSAPITVRNNGNAPFTVSVTGASAPYTVTPVTSTAVAPGTTQDFTVTCGSDTASPSNDQTLDVTSDAYAGGDQQVTVHCAIADTLVQVDPLAFDFGELRTNGGPQTRMLTATVTNPTTSTTPARLHSMRLRETRPGLTLSPANTDTTLAVGQTVTAVLALENSADTDLAGQFLDIHVDGELLALPVTGKVVTASSRVAPEELDLGTACVGTQVSGNVMLVNDGTATLQVDAPQMDQSFVASSPGTPAQLPPSMSLTATVSPAMDATGAIAGVLTWHDDVPSDHAVPVALEYVATGTALSPRGLDFGSVEVDVPAPPQRIKIQNCDMTPTDIEIESLRTKRGTLGAWHIDPRVGYGKQLAGREEQSISVTFEPPARGRYEADLTVITADGKQVIHLVGDATGRDFDRTSFYACACRAPGAPVHGWPIAVAIAIVIFRRRRGSS